MPLTMITISKRMKTALPRLYIDWINITDHSKCIYKIWKKKSYSVKGEKRGIGIEYDVLLL